MSSYRLGPVSERPSPAQPAPISGGAAPTTSDPAPKPGQTSQMAPPNHAPQAPASFDQLGLTPDLLRTVAAQDYTEPTPVQAQSIPIVLAGRDLLAGAQTGTGKTAAFVLPILQLLDASRPAVRYLPGGKGRRGATGLPIRCLVLTPTRELALQIEESVRTYGAERPIRSTTIYGGVGFQPQVRALRDGPEIVVATPGRLLDHAGQGTIDLKSVEILVLDEADRMLDMGFIRDIRRILALLPARRQNLLFSATFSDEIRELAAGLLHDPAYVQIARRNAPIELVRQVVYPVDRERKRELLSHLIRGGRIDRALVFTRTKHGANRLAEQLGADGILAAAIHGNKSQGQRVRALDDFKAGRVAILVATEVASRGLDIEGLPHVVNFELPTVAQDYVHRIGRTGRAGMEGDAVSLVCIDEATLLSDIETLLREPIRREVVPGFEVDRSIRREPIRQRSGDIRPAGGRRMPARQSVPGAFRQSALSGSRQPIGGRTIGLRQDAPGGFRRPAPSDFNQVAPRASRQATPGGFRQATPSVPSIGYAPARRPQATAQPPTRTAHMQAGRTSAVRPGIGAGRPMSGAYARPMPGAYARPMPGARPGDQGAPHAFDAPHASGRPERRTAFVSLPGERIARLDNRPV